MYKYVEYSGTYLALSGQLKEKTKWLSPQNSSSVAGKGVSLPFQKKVTNS